MIISLWTNKDDEKQAILKLTRKIFADSEISSSGFFDWQYLDNPEGEAIIVIARDENNHNKVIGVESILPINILINQKIIKASLSCNSYVDPDYRNKGIFSKLISFMIKECKKKNILCTYGVANDNSFNSFLKKGSHEISDLPILFRPLRLSKYFPFPLNKILKPFDIFWKIKNNTNSNIIQFDNDFDDSFEILVKKVSDRIPIIKQRTKEFLNWRYRNHPTRNYKIFVLMENSQLQGYIITRQTTINGKSVGVIVDFLVNPDINSKKINDLIQTALYDFWNSDISIAISLSESSIFVSKPLRHFGFKTIPKFLKPTSAHLILINSELNQNSFEQLKQLDHWFFSFGDYDVF